MSTITTAPATTPASDNIYSGLEALISANIAKVNISQVDVFKVDVKHNTGKSLFSHYLEQYPESDRGHYNCRVCAEWLRRYGQLVTIKDGVVSSVAFGTIPEGTDPGVTTVATALSKLVISQPVTSIYTPISNKAVIQNDGSWSHFHGTFDSDLLFI